MLTDGWLVAFPFCAPDTPGLSTLQFSELFTSVKWFFFGWVEAWKGRYVSLPRGAQLLALKVMLCIKAAVLPVILEKHLLSWVSLSDLLFTLWERWKFAKFSQLFFGHHRVCIYLKSCRVGRTNLATALRVQTSCGKCQSMETEHLISLLTLVLFAKLGQPVFLQQHSEQESVLRTSLLFWFLFFSPFFSMPAVL